MTSTILNQPSMEPAESLLGAARALGPELSARALETERLGTMPADLVARVRAAGLFRILQPRTMGGFELEPAATIRISRSLPARMLRPAGRS